MQKQKITPTTYLVLQNTYDCIEVALYKDLEILEKKVVDKFSASKNLIPEIDSILKRNNLTIENLSFIGVNEGPGPFTTLRIVISTANALNYATNIPLIGINGLDAIIKEYQNVTWPVTAVLLNAFNKDVYYAIQYNEKIEIGWKNIDEFLLYLKDKFKESKIRFIGNGVNLYKDNIQKIFTQNILLEENISQPSIEQIAKMVYQKWIESKEITNQILPLYLKEAIKINK